MVYHKAVIFMASGVEISNLTHWSFTYACNSNISLVFVQSAEVLLVERERERERERGGGRFGEEGE